MIRFDNEKVLLLQQIVIESSGGTAGVRDFGLLDSAVNGAYQTFDGIDLYPSKEEKAAWLGFALVSNHAFVDGNKRIGLLVMLSFLEMNGINMDYTDQDLIDLGIGVADGKIKYDDVLNWIKHNKKVALEH